MLQALPVADNIQTAVYLHMHGHSPYATLHYNSCCGVQSVLRHAYANPIVHVVGDSSPRGNAYIMLHQNEWY